MFCLWLAMFCLWQAMFWLVTAHMLLWQAMFWLVTQKYLEDYHNRPRATSANVIL